jgi:regulatory protein
LVNKDDPDEAESTASRLIFRAEQSCSGLLTKLRARGYTKAAATSAVEKLIEQNLVDDERFARMWLSARLRKRKVESPRILQVRLHAKGIPSTIAASALETVLDRDTELDLLRKYIAQSPETPTKDKLRREGFSLEAIAESE